MRNPLFAVIKVPSFFFLITSQFFSQLAINLFNFVLLLVVFKLSQSNLAVAGVVLSFTIPSIVFGILAGVYVDNWNKKKVLVYANVLRAVGVFPIVFVSSELFLIYLFSFLVTVVTQFFIPAEAPMIPQLVKKPLLLSANAWYSMCIFGSIIIAFALSGPLVLFLGPTKVFILITILYVVSALFAALIRYEYKEKTVAEKINLFEEIKSSFTLMASKNNVYHSLFLLTLLQTLILLIATVGPGYATQVLHIQIEQFPLLFVTPAIIGMATGALIIGNFLHKRSKQNLAKLGLLVFGTIMVIFPHGSFLLSQQFVGRLNSILPQSMNINSIHLMLIMAVIIGFAFSLIFVPSTTLIQEETTDRQRGKIYGSLNTFIGVVSLVPVLGVGILADSIGVPAVISGIGICVIGIALLRIFKFK